MYDMRLNLGVQLIKIFLFKINFLKSCLERTAFFIFFNMKSELKTPSEIFDRLHKFVKNYDADGQANLFAEQGVWEFPFASGNFPNKIIGRENIRKFGKIGMENSKKAGRRIINYNSVTVHQTEEKNILIVEFELEGEIALKNIRYKIPYIQLLKIEEGKIALLRDYFPMEILKDINHQIK